MNDKEKREIDRATKAVLNMGSVPNEKDPKFSKTDLGRKFRIRVDRKGQGRVERVEG